MSNHNHSFNQFQILETKLKPPYLRSAPLSRAQLAQRGQTELLNTGLLTLVGSAGSGKSTFMADLFRTTVKSGIQCCWLSLDEDDNEAAIFTKYIIASCFELAPESSKRGLGFLKSNPARNYDAFLDSVLTHIINVQGNCALFIDDFQYIQNPVLIRFWNKLISHAPPSLRIVIASRNQLPLDLSRRKIAQTITEIQQHELNLSEDEIFHYLKIQHQIDIPTSAAKSLYRSTEGWIAGVQLAALAIGSGNATPSDTIASFTGKDKGLTEYLLQTVLNGLPDEIRTFLLNTAPLSRFSSELCNCVCDQQNSQEILAYLEQHNLFIVAQDREAVWYRYHHLFADFLKSELLKNKASKYKEICMGAAQWCETEGLLTESIQYWLHAEEFEKAAELIAARAPAIAIHNGDHHSILDWMRRLPEKYHSSRPQLLLNYAFSCAFTREPKKSIALCNQVLNGLEQNNIYNWALTETAKAQCYWLAKTTEAVAIVATDELNSSIEKCRQLLDDTPPAEAFNIAAVYNCMAYAYLGKREYPESLHAATEAYNCSFRSDDAYVRVWSDFIAGFANVEMGKLSNALENATRAKRNAGTDQDVNSYLSAMAAFIQAEINIQQCNFDESNLLENVGQSFSAIFGPVEPLLIAVRNEARQLVWKGKLNDARKVLHQGQETALATRQSRLYYGLIAEEITLQLQFDKLVAAKETIQRSNFFNTKRLKVASECRTWIDEATRLVSARLLLAEGQGKEAITLINKMINAANTKQDYRLNYLLSLRSIKAVALWQLDQKTESARELDKVISLASQEQHAYPIVSAGRIILDILEALLEKRSENYVGKDLQVKHCFEDHLVALMKGELTKTNDSVRPNNTSNRLTNTLTTRELDMLKLVGAGFGNKQIAEELIISISTVKWHLRNIYQKIGVNSRTAAAAHAHKANLIE